MVDARDIPLDAAATASLAEAGLEYRRVDATSAGFARFAQAITRGFLGQESTDEQIEGSREGLAERRLTGVFDPASLQPDTPVGTVDSWVADLATPGGDVPMWAISAVTVAPTHRRRGIARHMLEGELRAAATCVPVAGLTVSEATIYGRFGFAPAAFATDWTIDSSRARWIGPRPGGRIDFVDRDAARDELAALHERVRVRRPGEIAVWPGLWRRMTGTAPGQEGGRKTRVVRYADVGGTTRGIALYHLSEDRDDFAKHTLDLTYLLTETPDAYAALWRYALEHDLVSTVKAPLRSVDEPLRWMIADQRAAHVTTSEHQWLRILDVPAALTARRYAASAGLTIDVRDDLDFAAGVWRIAIDDAGAAAVERAEASAVPDLTLTVADLSALLVGGVRASTLHAAGRIEGARDAVAAIEHAFAAADTPYLSVWY